MQIFTNQPHLTLIERLALYDASVKEGEIIILSPIGLEFAAKPNCIDLVENNHQ